MTRRHVLALLGGGALLAACGSDEESAATSTAATATTAASDSTSSGSTPPVGSDGPASSEAPSSTAAGQIEGVPDISLYDTSATFRFQISVGPTRHDPHRAASGFDTMFLFLSYDRLIHLSPDASAIPGLATEWEFSEDGKQLTLQLREGVVFQDGTPFDASAVKANIERGQTVEGSVVSTDLSVIESVEIVDPLQVVFHLNGGAAHLPLVLSDRAGAMVSPAAFENDDLDLFPVGTGMYTVTDNRPGDRVIYEPFADHWDVGAVRVAKFELTVVADPRTRLSSIRTGAIDFTLVDPSMAPEAEAAGIVVAAAANLGYQHLHLNRSFEPFANLKVRQALNHAIDRAAIVQGLLIGLADASCQIFPEGYFGFDPATGTDTYPFDVDKAKALLAEGGYPDGFEFEIITQPVPRLVQLSEILQQQLGAVGLKVTITQVEAATLADLFFVQKRGDACVGLWSGRSDPTQTLEAMFSETGFENPGKTSTPAVLDKIAATKIVQSTEARAKAVQAASAQVTADALDVPIAFEYRPWIASPKVIGYRTWLTGKPEWRYVGIAKA